MWYRSSINELMSLLGTTEHGLTTREVEKRLAEQGENSIRAGKRKSFFSRFLASMCDRMTICLLVA